MKNKYMLIIVTSSILGILIGIVMKDYNDNKDLHISKDKLTNEQIKITKKSIKELNKEAKSLYKELDFLKLQHNNTEHTEEILGLKDILSYTDINGEGVSIKLDAQNESIGNIANFVDYNKILINIINEVKVNGGKFISINGERINQYTEIVLAGSHININSMPIAPPYDIKIIGDSQKLSNYINNENNYLKNIQLNYPIKLDTKVEKNITMKKMNLPNKLNYIGGY